MPPEHNPRGPSDADGAPDAVLAAFAKDTGAAAEAVAKLLENPTPERAAALLKDLPNLLPDDPALASVIAEEMAKSYGEAWEKARQGEELMNGECRAKDPAHCPTHGTPEPKTESGYTAEHRAKIGQTGDWRSLGLPAMRDITPDPPITFNKEAEAKARIMRGETVTNPFGDVLHIDKRSMGHIGKKGRDPRQLSDKLQSLDGARETVEHPHEIWMGDNGRRLYVRITAESNGRRVVNAVEQSPDLLLSWHTNPVSYDHYRHGELQWLRN